MGRGRRITVLLAKRCIVFYRFMPGEEGLYPLFKAKTAAGSLQLVTVDYDLSKRVFFSFCSFLSGRFFDLFVSCLGL